MFEEDAAKPTLKHIQDIFSQSLVNYKELWKEWLEEIDDGSWDRKATEENIKQFETIIKIFDLEVAKKLNN